MSTIPSLLNEPAALHRFIIEEMKQKYNRLLELKKKKISASLGTSSFLLQEESRSDVSAASSPKGICNKKACRSSSVRRPGSIELRNLRSRKTIHNLLLRSWRNRRKDKQHEINHGTDS